MGWGRRHGIFATTGYLHIFILEVSHIIAGDLSFRRPVSCTRVLRSHPCPPRPVCSQSVGVVVAESRGNAPIADDRVASAVAIGWRVSVQIVVPSAAPPVMINDHIGATAELLSVLDLHAHAVGAPLAPVIGKNIVLTGDFVGGAVTEGQTDVLPIVLKGVIADHAVIKPTAAQSGRAGSVIVDINKGVVGDMR